MRALETEQNDGEKIVVIVQRDKHEKCCQTPDPNAL
jgi:hypothetical protein